jgi:hypothetical protein
MTNRGVHDFRLSRTIFVRLRHRVDFGPECQRAESFSRAGAEQIPGSTSGATVEFNRPSIE